MVFTQLIYPFSHVIMFLPKIAPTSITLPCKTLYPLSDSLCKQHANKVMSDSPGLVDFAIGLVYSVLNLSTKQVDFFWKFKLQKNCNQF